MEIKAKKNVLSVCEVTYENSRITPLPDRIEVFGPAASPTRFSIDEETTRTHHE